MFIIIPILKAESEPGFKIIEDDEQSIFISLNKLLVTENTENINNSILNKITIESYLDSFTKNIKPKPVKKIINPRVKLIIKEDDESEVNSEVNLEEKINQIKPTINIVEESKDIPVDFIKKPKKSKKVRIVAINKKKQQTVKKRKLLIDDSNE